MNIMTVKFQVLLLLFLFVFVILQNQVNAQNGYPVTNVTINEEISGAISTVNTWNYFVLQDVEASVITVTATLNQSDDALSLYGRNASFPTINTNDKEALELNDNRELSFEVRITPTLLDGKTSTDYYFGIYAAAGIEGTVGYTFKTSDEANYNNLVIILSVFFAVGGALAIAGVLAYVTLCMMPNLIVKCVPGDQKWTLPLREV
eukprot:gb/GECH01010443.1/.p1 GENE.gb/GECH01010443.1/~~gb/GECH01010443.1/.p1  ORF type:complete len:205 (+),score=36.98 gb/GECH01010443.1/:1-615(+)